MRISVGLLALRPFSQSKKPTGSVHWPTAYDLPGKGCDPRTAQFCYTEITSMSMGRVQLSSVPTMAFYFLSLGSSSQEKGITS